MRQALADNTSAPARAKENIYFHCPNDQGRSLSSLCRNVLISKLAEYGVVLLRGFTTDTAQFSNLVTRMTPQTAIDPARAFFAKNVQLVDSGVNEIGLHCENGTTPLVPNVVWFYCERAAVTGSQTTVCDGFEVWETLSPQAKDLFRARKIRFSRNVKSEFWIKYVKHHFPQTDCPGIPNGKQAS